MDIMRRHLPFVIAAAVVALLIFIGVRNTPTILVKIDQLI
jgi:hypothetical protein